MEDLLAGWRGYDRMLILATPGRLATHTGRRTLVAAFMAGVRLVR